MRKIAAKLTKIKIFLKNNIYIDKWNSIWYYKNTKNDTRIVVDVNPSNML